MIIIPLALFLRHVRGFSDAQKFVKFGFIFPGEHIPV